MSTQTVVTIPVRLCQKVPPCPSPRRTGRVKVPEKPANDSRKDRRSRAPPSTRRPPSTANTILFPTVIFTDKRSRLTGPIPSTPTGSMYRRMDLLRPIHFWCRNGPANEKVSSRSLTATRFFHFSFRQLSGRIAFFISYEIFTLFTMILLPYRLLLLTVDPVR
jgi:hypothetical protein